MNETSGAERHDAPAPTGETPEEEPFDRERAMSTIRKLREEAKRASAAIKELDVLRAERQAAADAQLTEQQKLARRTEMLEAELAFERQERQDRVNRYEVQLAASRLGIVDPEAAVKLLDWSGLEFADDGTPRDIDKALKMLLHDRPYLAGAQAPRMAATNAASRGSTPGARLYTRAEFNDYRFYDQHREDMQLAMREGRIIE